jgi:hypothetical protein
MSTPMDWWYMVYKDEEGVIHTVKGTMHGIRRSLKENLLGNATGIRVARDKKGPYEPLRAFADFRDLDGEMNRLPATTETVSPWADAEVRTEHDSTHAGDAPAANLPPAPPYAQPFEQSSPLASSGTGTTAAASVASALAALAAAAAAPEPGHSSDPLFLDMHALAGYRRPSKMKYIMLMLFGAGLGILGYIFFTRHSHFRLF